MQVLLLIFIQDPEICWRVGWARFWEFCLYIVFLWVLTIILEIGLCHWFFYMIKIILSFFSVHAHILHIHTSYKNDIKDVDFAGSIPLRIFILKLKYRHMRNYFDSLCLLLNSLWMNYIKFACISKNLSESFKYCGDIWIQKQKII